MRVFRTQWPVGQGCFSSGIIDAEGVEPKHYVYDCGARNLEHLRPIASCYADGVRKLDALFVSHLDGDHVDGLDTLLATLSPKEVYLPYLDIADQVTVILEAEAAGRLTTSLVEAQLDPVEWFGRRGAETVIFVRNDGDAPEGGFAPPPADPDREPARGEPIRLKRIGEVRGAGPNRSSGSTSSTQALEMMVGGSVCAIRGSATEWILVPFVPAVDPARTAAFRGAIRAALKLGPHQPITAKDVKDKLKDKDGRTALRACYDEILSTGAGRNHNKVSMSLYSGPPAPPPQFSRKLRHRGWNHGSVYRWTCNGGPGWIGTGDAKLKSDRRRREWERFYQAVAPIVGTFLLPHHGSKANWHRDLVDATAADLFVAASDEPNEGYEHPSPSVVFDIVDAERNLALVTKRAQSRLTEWVDLR
jgi:hypothetical protein